MFHQGYTDILNCLPLVNYYSKVYDKIKVIIREDFKESVSFYLRNLKNVDVIYLDINHIRKVHNPFIMVNLFIDVDTLFHGSYDTFRNDIFKNKFNDSTFYGHGFYEFYNISLNEKVENFIFERDNNKEDKLFDEVIGNENKKYILFHENDDDKIEKNKPYEYVNLESLSKNIFESIKILQKSEEIHLVDSLWASLCFLLDAKYKLFSEKKIYLYPFKNRGGGCIWNKFGKELKPFKPSNWVIV